MGYSTHGEEAPPNRSMSGWAWVPLLLLASVPLVVVAAVLGFYLFVHCLDHCCYGNRCPSAHVGFFVRVVPDDPENGRTL